MATFSPRRPPANQPVLVRISQLSFEAENLQDVYDALVWHGATVKHAPMAQTWRLEYKGGLAMAYASGKIVLGGADQTALRQLLKSWTVPGTISEGRQATLW